ncbi:MAG: PHP domain-containing protein [Candidatus Woesearchaeota archaeon]
MLKIDLHIHTLHSGHAYGSFYEVVNEAKKKKMNMIAITDHGPEMIGTASYIHFIMGHRKPEYKNLKILWGCEANIIDAKGNIDLESSIQKKLDIILVGLHSVSKYQDLGIIGNTNAVINMLKNPDVDILTHPTHPQYKYDFEKVFKAALDNNVLLELNLAYLQLYSDETTLKLFKKMIDMTRAAGKKLIVNSDSHFIHEIGDDTILKKYWSKLGLTKDIIINNYPTELIKFLERKKK